MHNPFWLIQETLRCHPFDARHASKGWTLAQQNAGTAGAGSRSAEAASGAVSSRAWGNEGGRQVEKEIGSVLGCIKADRNA